MTMFWEITIESNLLNQFQWSWYHSFQKTMFYLIKSKYFEYQSNKNRTFRFLGDTRYMAVSLRNVLLKHAEHLLKQRGRKKSRSHLLENVGRAISFYSVLTPILFHSIPVCCIINIVACLCIHEHYVYVYISENHARNIPWHLLLWHSQRLRAMRKTNNPVVDRNKIWNRWISTLLQMKKSYCFYKVWKSK